jgi:hypothetical protein
VPGSSPTLPQPQLEPRETNRRLHNFFRLSEVPVIGPAAEDQGLVRGNCLFEQTGVDSMGRQQ